MLMNTNQIMKEDLPSANTVEEERLSMQAELDMRGMKGSGALHA